jgi:hypothetical protein
LNPTKNNKKSDRTLFDEPRDYICATYLHPPDRDLSVNERSNEAEVIRRINRRYRIVRTKEHKLIDAHDLKPRLDDLTEKETQGDSSIITNLLEIAEMEGLPLESGNSNVIDFSDRSRKQLEDLGYL